MRLFAALMDDASVIYFGLVYPLVCFGYGVEARAYIDCMGKLTSVVPDDEIGKLQEYPPPLDGVDSNPVGTRHTNKLLTSKTPTVYWPLLNLFMGDILAFCGDFQISQSKEAI